MKTLAFWHEYPGSHPEPEKPVVIDESVAVWALFIFMLTLIATQGARR